MIPISEYRDKRLPVREFLRVDSVSSVWVTSDCDFFAEMFFMLLSEFFLHEFLVEDFFSYSAHLPSCSVALNIHSQSNGNG